MAENLIPGPVLTAEQMAAVGNDFALIMQNLDWHPGEVHAIDEWRLENALQQKGHTLACVRAYIQDLLGKGVCQRQATRDIPSTLMYPNGFMVEVAGDEFTWQLMLSHDAWYGYLTPPPANAKQPDTPAALPSPNHQVGPAEDAEAFFEFTVKQRRLLRALSGKGLVPFALVKKAIYGTLQVANSALERLIGRTNKSLVSRNYALEITGGSRGLRLRPL
jgi:hypothetical protein